MFQAQSARDLSIVKREKERAGSTKHRFVVARKESLMIRTNNHVLSVSEPNSNVSKREHGDPVNLSTVKER